jgi:hypothetical protein
MQWIGWQGFAGLNQARTGRCHFWPLPVRHPVPVRARHGISMASLWLNRQPEWPARQDVSRHANCVARTTLGLQNNPFHSGDVSGANAFNAMTDREQLRASLVPTTAPRTTRECRVCHHRTHLGVGGYLLRLHGPWRGGDVGREDAWPVIGSKRRQRLAGTCRQGRAGRSRRYLQVSRPLSLAISRPGLHQETAVVASDQRPLRSWQEAFSQPATTRISRQLAM